MNTAEDIFVEKIDTLAKSFDAIGLYIIDMAMIVVNEDNINITDLEKLRKLTVEDDVRLYLDVECIAGNEAWRNPQLFTMSDIEDYFK